MTGILSGLTGSGGGPAETSASAADAQAQAAKIGIAEQKRQFDESQTRLKPWLAAGTKALGLQSDYAGVNGAAKQAAAFNNYTSSPNQASYVNAGMDALNRNSVALGGIGNPNIINALKTQGAGWAAQDYENQYNRLAGLSNTGQATGGQIGALGQNAANAIGNLSMNAANAKASGIVAGQQAQTAQNQQLGSAAIGLMAALL